MFVDDDRTEIFNRAHLDLDVELVRKPAQSSRALNVIVAYKLVRSGLTLLLAIGLGTFLALGRAESIVEVAVQLRKHFSSSVASTFSDVVLRNLVPIRLWLVVAGLTVDSVLTGIEGFALRTGKPWGTWLVLFASVALVPFEVSGLLRAPHIGRAILLAINVLVGIYLLRRAMRDGS
jgi:uncharacterized membrane protein (DUF2068 family)